MRRRLSEASARADMLGSAVEADGRAVLDAPAELGGDDHLVAQRGEGFTDEFLVDVGAVDLGGVEEGDAGIDGAAQHGDHGVAVTGIGAVALGHAHGTQADRRNPKSPTRPFVHGEIPVSGLVGCGVLLVGDGLQPGGAVAVGDSFEHRNVAHHAVHPGTVPVLLTRRGPDRVTGGEPDDSAVAGDDQAGAVCAEQRLSQRVGVPVGARTGVNRTMLAIRRDGSAFCLIGFK